MIYFWEGGRGVRKFREEEFRGIQKGCEGVRDKEKVEEH
jgi:hypothetical protein